MAGRCSTGKIASLDVSHDLLIICTIDAKPSGPSRAFLTGKTKHRAPTSRGCISMDGIA